jgi:hypothetical protein
MFFMNKILEFDMIKDSKDKLKLWLIILMDRMYNDV